MRPLLFLAVVILVETPAAAQDTDRPSVIAITQYTFVAWLIPPPYTGFPAAAEIGPLLRISERDGLGWTATLDVTHSTPYLGTGPRYRRWLDERWALDLGASVPITDSGFAYMVLQSGVSYREIVGFTSRIGLGGYDGLELGFGAQAGSTPGLAATGVTTVVMLVAGIATIVRWSGYGGGF